MITKHDISDDGIVVLKNGEEVMRVINFVGGETSLDADIEFVESSKKARLSMNWVDNKVEPVHFNQYLITLLNTRLNSQ